MLLRSQAFAVFSAWVVRAPSAHSELIPYPSNEETSIVVQESLNTFPSAGRISITSDIPVNIQRYADVDAQFLDGSQPVSGANVQVIVTSTCDAPIVPTVEWDNVTGALDIKLDEESDVSYLEPSWYQALWSYRSYWADYLYTTDATEITLTAEIQDTDENSAALTASTNKADPSSAITTTVPLSEEDASSDATPQDESTSEQSSATKENDGSPSSTFRGSFIRQTITTFMILYATNIIFMGVDGNAGLLGFGKVVVAAIGISTLFTETYTKSHVKHGATRQLQSCIYNVDILIDGCYNSFTINAPAARILEANMVNLTSTQNVNDTATTDYSAVLQFPVSENNTELQPNTTVPNVYCDIMVEGRPFIDVTGKSLQASSVVEVADSSWLGYLPEEESRANGNFGNETFGPLGEEWTRRALAEHASVASFSAFSIALMTNQAPSTLVEDALNAALDEVRHAKVSFDIASMLSGREIGPGPLPASNLDFKHDLTALALAVAKEGCVDETLSTFSAALEANEIQDAIESADGTKYSGVDVDTLAVMRDELKQIALEESAHSALAWRTLNWICSINSDACNAVHEQVFDEDRFEMRINQVITDKHSEVLRMIQKEWDSVFVSHKMKIGLYSDGQEHVCDAVFEEDIHSNDAAFIFRLTSNIRKSLC